MTAEYFSDRELGKRPQTEEEIPANAWGGIAVLINTRIDDGSFGFRYPDVCLDGAGAYGTNRLAFKHAIQAEIPGIDFPLDPMDPSQVPPTLVVLDVIQFCYRSIAQPIERDFHSFFRHTHLGFNQANGQESFREDINRILARNGLAYELCSDGVIIRLLPEGIRQMLESTVFHTGDSTLDSILETARRKIFDPAPAVRREAIEELWDAWERLKTIEDSSNKKLPVTKLLNKAASEPYLLNNPRRA